MVLEGVSVWVNDFVIVGDGVCVAVEDGETVAEAVGVFVGVGVAEDVGVDEREYE